MPYICFGFARFELRYNLLLSMAYIGKLRSLQNVGGLYGLVVPCEEVQFPGHVVGYFTGGEPLRAILPKVQVQKINEQSSDCTEEGNVPGTGYGLQLTYDVPQGKHN